MDLNGIPLIPRDKPLSKDPLRNKGQNPNFFGEVLPIARRNRLDECQSDLSGSKLRGDEHTSTVTPMLILLAVKWRIEVCSLLFEPLKIVLYMYRSMADVQMGGKRFHGWFPLSLVRLSAMTDYNINLPPSSS